MTILDRLSSALTTRYRLDRELGAGGMATVYLAHDLKHEREVAIKVLHPDLGVALGGERFLAEIKTTAKLQHPHILPLLDSGEADGLLYYVMPFVRGETLRARLERERQLPIADAVRIAREVAGALEHAHKQGIIHRDIKPENILLQDGAALVADFGIALAVQTAGGVRMTQTGLSLGTPSYMSPEQAMGERTIDARSDIYALGAVTYEMLAGEPPFSGASVQAIVAKVLSERPVALRTVRDTVPDGVEAAVMTALAKLPADRHVSASVFSDAINASASTAAAPGARRPRSMNAVRRGTLITTAAACLILGAAGARAWTRQKSATGAAPRIRAAIEVPHSATVFPDAGIRGFAFSPTGTEMAWIARGASATEMQRRLLDSLDLLPVSVGDGPIIVDYAHDGRSLYVVNALQTVLRRVPLDGSRADTIASGVADFGAGPKGALVVIRSNGALQWRAADGGQLADVLAPQDSMRLTDPFLMPDGQSVLANVTSERDTASRIVQVDLTRRTIRMLSVIGRRPRLIAKGVMVFGDGRGLQAVRVDESLAPIGAPVRVTDGVRYTRLTPQYGVADNGTMVYVGGTADLTLGSVDENGREFPLSGLQPGRYFGARWSPDGSRVVVERNEGGRSDIWVVSRESGAAQRLTRDGRSRFPEWSADGKRVFWLTNNGASNDVYWQEATGAGAPERLPLPAQKILRIAPSPDGAHLVISAGAPYRHDLLLVRLDGTGQPVPIATDPGDEVSPHVSPDGKWVAYSSNQTGRYETWVVKLDNPSTRVQVSADGTTSPVWAREEATLYTFTASHAIRVQLRLGAGVEVIKRDTLFENFAVYGSAARGADVDPRTGRLLMVGTSAERRSRIIVVTDWLADVRKRLGLTS